MTAPRPSAATLPPWLRATGPQASLLAVAAVPGAAKSALAGVHDGCLRIRLAAPPVDGKANDELVRFVAGLLQLPRRDVALERGPASRRKTICIALDAASVAALIEPLLDDVA
jgi:uncharacterized protein